MIVNEGCKPIGAQTGHSDFRFEIVALITMTSSQPMIARPIPTSPVHAHPPRPPSPYVCQPNTLHVADWGSGGSIYGLPDSTSGPVAYASFLVASWVVL